MMTDYCRDVRSNYNILENEFIWYILSQRSIMSGIDPQQFKEAQRKSWDSVAPALQEWWRTFENAAQVVSDHLVELAKINPDSRVLDIATGIGEPAITAAKKNS